MPDRIEAGSYACAAGITGGSLDLIGARPDDMQATLNALAQCGLMIEFHNRGIKVSANGGMRPLALSTSPFPGFATDMQAQFMAMLASPQGDSFLEETIFENRYMHVPELRRMGADVDIHGRSAIVHGVEAADRRERHGDRPSRLDEPGACGACGGGRDRGAARLPPRPRL